MGLISYGLVHREGSKDNRGVTYHTEVYEVIVDTMNEYQGTVGLYVPGNVFTGVHPNDWLARCKKKTVAQVGPKEDGGVLWTVTLEYDSEPLDFNQAASGGGAPSGDPGQGAQEVQPDLRPPQISIDQVEVQELLTEDYAGVTVQASNGQPFSPPLSVTTYRPQITITLLKAIGADSFANSITYTGKVNTTVFLGFPVGSLLCKKYSLQSQFEHGAWWWNKTLVLEGKESLWNPVKILDAGTFEKISGGDPRYEPIRDREGQPVTDAVPLDGSGHALAPGGTPVFKEFKGYQTISYAGIL